MWAAGVGVLRYNRICCTWTLRMKHAHCGERLLVGTGMGRGECAAAAAAAGACRGMGVAGNGRYSPWVMAVSGRECTGCSKTSGTFQQVCGTTFVVCATTLQCFVL